MNLDKSAPKVIIACDFQSKIELNNFLAKFPPSEKLFLKLGMELVYGVGFEIIQELKNRGHAIFLDLKLHDIPVTMLKALHSLNQYKVDFLTIHLAAGQKSLDLLAQEAPNLAMKLLGVSVLTSLDDQDVQTLFQNPALSSNGLALNLAGLAARSNLYGLICSPREAKVIKSTYPKLKLITPGIQMGTNQQSDQKRVATPRQAAEWGSDFLVVGRLITQSLDPYQTYKTIIKEFINENN
ncbi:orotidine-5'-phosphate decarboxylase [Entomoplasma freundtii]|uniref:Orotidine 5'-phosphate decarboxylase n=1 Tax=Entomoplasma freundtii TaxID=74700 RepID=A0A2K8NQN1_9MOLU|nr:orotidine-5'-phosphate decarboxylase [Entomoplasma freundtii]ATZ16129.1 orotidine 5'-phosphate decarboxylase [Entomoplasma freundtii]TDY56970.1 orotidine-5'-phosphate decarboxylase [Entomoplasma freundtii]